MKTSVIMIRKMGQFSVSQRSSDGMFNSTSLLQQWNYNTISNKKIIKDFIKLSQTKEFMNELETYVDSQKDFSPDGKTKVIHVIKGRNTKKGKTPDITWMHPYLFIKFAMWLNPRFEIKVIKFIYDQLIEYRNDAGDNYNGLTSAVQKFKDINYSSLAKGLNYIVFGRHEKGIRQIATQDQLKELTQLQRNLAFAVDMGLITSFDMLVDKMRGIYYDKYIKQ